MPIKPAWSNAEKLILRIDFEAPVTSWAEYDAAVDEAYQMVREVQHAVWLIYNPGSVVIPQGSAIPHIRRSMKLAPPNIEGVISVNTNLFARNLLGVVSRLVALRSIEHRMIFASSLDEAYKIIAAKQKA